MDPNSADTANSGSDTFLDTNGPDDLIDQTTHASAGAPSGILGSLNDSWEPVNYDPDSTGNLPGGTARAVTGPGQPDVARASGSATDDPPPPQVMSPSPRMDDLEAYVQQIRKDVDDEYEYIQQISKDVEKIKG